MEGLKLWARTELQRQKVADVSTAMRAAECLMDYQSEPRKEWLQGGHQDGYQDNHQGSYQSNHQGSYQGNHQGSYWNKEKALESKSSTAPRKDGCFLYGGPHRVKD
ncbi:Retrotrans gag domain-containing protein [Abeliophyllum distichum]|uniref:Retrotrans gag domain-containing protein n=1 Tax=Abeliophyllum distichum TaxID=126358 RepID=A0ABD1VWC5_9LAMI